MYILKNLKLAAAVGLASLLLAACSTGQSTEESLKQELESAQAELAEKEMKESIEASLRAELNETTERDESQAATEAVQVVQSTTVVTEYKTLYVVNCDEYVTLRTSPNTAAEEVCRVPFGEVVSYIEPAANGFYRVTYLGRDGYILASYLADEPQARRQSSAKPAIDYVYDRYGTSILWVVNCNVSITLRSQPQTSASAICQIPLGSRVEAIGLADNGFLRINYNGYTGYALEQYLDVAEPQTYIGMYARVINCRESITLRSQPSTTAAEICQIPLGEVVYCVSWSNDEFYQVVYDGYEGYALTEYLKLE